MVRVIAIVHDCIQLKFLLSREMQKAKDSDANTGELSLLGELPPRKTCFSITASLRLIHLPHFFFFFCQSSKIGIRKNEQAYKLLNTLRGVSPIATDDKVIQLSMPDHTVGQHNSSEAWES